MVKFLRRIVIIILIPGITLIFIQSCAEDPDPSLFGLIDPDVSVPVISTIDPLGQAVAGVTVVTITGSNFSDDASQLVASFNGVSGTILEATPTVLKVKVPNVIADSVAVRVSKIDAEPFSNLFQYRLTPALAEIKKNADGSSDIFSEDLIPNGLTTDAQGNVYTSVTEFNVNIGIKKITPSGLIIPFGTLIDFAPPGGSGGTLFHRLNMWQNNTIIAARRVAAVFQVSEGVTASVFTSQVSGASIYDIDFDQSLNVWAGGTGSTQGGPSLFRVTPSLEVKSFSYFSPIKSIRIFNNYVYIITTVNNEDLIKRFRIISSDSLGNPEDFFNIGQSVLPDSGTVKVTGTDFDIANDGDIIVGTTKNTNPIIIIHQDGSFEPLYPGVIPQGTRVFAFAWDSGQYLYFTREATTGKIQSILRLDMQKEGAPHFGR